MDARLLPLKPSLVSRRSPRRPLAAQLVPFLSLLEWNVEQCFPPAGAGRAGVGGWRKHKAPMAAQAARGVIFLPRFPIAWPPSPMGDGNDLNLVIHNAIDQLEGKPTKKVAAGSVHEYRPALRGLRNGFETVV